MRTLRYDYCVWFQADPNNYIAPVTTLLFINMSPVKIESVTFEAKARSDSVVSSVASRKLCWYTVEATRSRRPRVKRLNKHIKFSFCIEVEKSTFCGGASCSCLSSFSYLCWSVHCSLLENIRSFAEVRKAPVIQTKVITRLVVYYSSHCGCLACPH